MASVDLTGVDELDVSLQVAVDHENLVAAWMRAGSLSHLLVMLLDVLLKTQPRRKTVTYTLKEKLCIIHSKWEQCTITKQSDHFFTGNTDTELGRVTPQNVFFIAEKHFCTDLYRSKLQCCYHCVHFFSFSLLQAGHPILSTKAFPAVIYTIIDSITDHLSF